MTTVITKLHDGQQVQIKGTRPYHQDCTIGTLRGFYAKNPFLGEYNKEAEDKELANWGKVFWVNLNATVMTSDVAYNMARNAEREATVHLAVGDQVEIDGITFTIENDNNNNFKLVEVK